MKPLFFVAFLAAFITSLCFVSCCSSPINTINDPHFDENGIYLDSLGTTFQAIMPTSLPDFDNDSPNSLTRVRDPFN